MPKAVDGEFGFAASGTCLVTAGDSHAYFGLRRCRQPDLLLQGPRQDLEGRQQPDPRRRRGRRLLPGVQGRARPASPSAATSPSPTTARTPRRTAPARTGPAGGDLGGYRSGVAWLSGGKPVAVAVGPTGSDITKDGGRDLEDLRRRVLRRGDVRRRRHLLGVRGRGRGRHPAPLTTPDRSVSRYRIVTLQGWSPSDTRVTTWHRRRSASPLGRNTMKRIRSLWWPSPPPGCSPDSRRRVRSRPRSTAPCRRSSSSRPRRSATPTGSTSSTVTSRWPTTAS